MRWRNNRINIETGSWPNLDYQLNTINWHPGKPLFNSINKINKFHLYQHHGVYQIRKHNNHQRHVTCKFHINIDSHCQRIWIQGFKRKYNHCNQYSFSVFESLAIVKDITGHNKPIRHSHTYWLTITKQYMDISELHSIQNPLCSTMWSFDKMGKIKRRNEWKCHKTQNSIWNNNYERISHNS